MSPDNDDYQAKSDARTMQDHAAIVADPKRHAAAHKHLKTMASNTASAVQTSAALKKKKPVGAALHQKVKSGLKRAFPDSSTQGA